MILLASGAGFAAPASPPTPPATGAAPAANQITFPVKQTTGMMAIGGETTGTIISDGKATYDLDIKDAGLRAKAGWGSCFRRAQPARVWRVDSSATLIMGG